MLFKNVHYEAPLDETANLVSLFHRCINWIRRKEYLCGFMKDIQQDKINFYQWDSEYSIASIHQRHIFQRNSHSFSFVTLSEGNQTLCKEDNSQKSRYHYADNNFKYECSRRIAPLLQI